MGGWAVSKQTEIVRLIGGGRLPLALEILAGFPDLQSDELPPLDKRTLRRLEDDPFAPRYLVQAAFSEPVSLRRFARKVLPRLGMEGHQALAMGIIESLRPLRPVEQPIEGLLGSFDGFASPLGRALAEQGHSYRALSPSSLSPAHRFVRDALEMASATLMEGPLSAWGRVFEWALLEEFRFFGEAGALVPPTGREESMAWSAGSWVRDFLRHGLTSQLAKGDGSALAALDRWARGNLFLEDDGEEGRSAYGRMRTRFLRSASSQRDRLRWAVQHEACVYLRKTLSPSQALDLYWILKAHPRSPGPWGPSANPGSVEGVLQAFAIEHPEDTQGAGPDPLPVLGYPGAKALPASGLRRVAVPSSGSSSASRGVPALEGDAPALVAPWEGPSKVDALGALALVARHGGLPRLWKSVRKTLGDDWPLADEECPARGSLGEGVEEALLELSSSLATAVVDAPERLRALAHWAGPRIFDDGSRVPERVLESLPAMATLAERVTQVRDPVLRLQTAMALLPASLLRSKASAWVEAVERLDQEGRWTVFTLVEKFRVTRSAAIVPVLAALVEGVAPYQRHPTEEWTLSAAILYRFGGTEGRASVLRALERLPLPTPDMMLQRHHSNRGWQWVCRHAWERRDGELLGAMVEAQLLPLYFQGDRPMVPWSEDVRADRTAPHEGGAPKGKELPLGEVVRFLVQSARTRIERALVRAVEIASFDRGARALLDEATNHKVLDSVVRNQVESLLQQLEAPKDGTQKRALTLMAGAPILFRDREREALEALERCVQTATGTVLRDVPAAILALGIAFPSHLGECGRLLEELLDSEDVPTLGESLRSLRGLMAQKPKGGNLALSTSARQRIEWLKDWEPKRLGKLAVLLLEARAS